MKQILTLLLSVALIFSLVACSGIAAPSQEDSVAVISSADTPEQAAAAETTAVPIPTDTPEPTPTPAPKRKLVDMGIKSGDYEYSTYSDQTITITSYLGTDAEATIPAELDGYIVIRVGNGAFFQNATLTSVTIADGVTSIGRSAFKWCQELSSVTIPDSVTNISAGAFIGTPWLFNQEQNEQSDWLELGNGRQYVYVGEETDVTVPAEIKSFDFVDSEVERVTISDGIKSIGESAFSGCTNLTSVVIPDSVTQIGYGAFSNCHKLTGVTIPESVTTIGDSAFFVCSALASIRIPDSVTSIGEEAFDLCGPLTIVCTEGSYAWYYAIKNNIEHQAG